MSADCRILTTAATVFILSTVLVGTGDGAQPQLIETGTHDLVVHDDGSVTVVGTFSGSVPFGSGPSGSNSAERTASAGGRDAFVVRYEADGTPRWVLPVGGVGDDEGRCVVALENGDVVVSGFFQGAVDFDPTEGEMKIETSGKEAEQFLARFDSAGRPVWVRTLGVRTERSGSRESDRGPIAIAVASDQSIIVVGTVVEGQGRDRRYEGLAQRWDEHGKLSWSASLALDGDEVFPLSVAATKGGFLVSGFALAGALKQPEIFVGAFDRKGQELWSRGWSGPMKHAGRAIAGAPEMFYSTGEATAVGVDRKGGIWVTGYVRGDIDFDPDGRSKGDVLRAAGESRLGFLLALDARGAFRGVFSVEPKALGSVGDAGSGTTVRDLIIDHDGSVVVAGVRRSFQKSKRGKLGLSHLFVQRFRKGRLAWSRTWGKKGALFHSRGHAVAITADSTTLVGGAGPPQGRTGAFAHQGDGVVLAFDKRGKPRKAQK